MGLYGSAWGTTRTIAIERQYMSLKATDSVWGPVWVTTFVRAIEKRYMSSVMATGWCICKRLPARMKKATVVEAAAAATWATTAPEVHFGLAV